MVMIFCPLVLCAFINQTSFAVKQTTSLSQSGDDLIHAINHAKKTIDISIYTIIDAYSLAKSKNDLFYQALIAANKRGVNVTLLLNRFKMPPSHIDNFEKNHMKLLNVENDWCTKNAFHCWWSSSAFEFSHEKYVIIDGEIGYILTGNLPWDPCNKANCVLDYAYRTTNHTVVSFMQHLFKTDLLNSQFGTRFTPSPIPERLVVAPVDSSWKMARFILKSKDQLDIIQPFLAEFHLSKTILSSLNKILKKNISVRILTSSVVPVSQWHLNSELEKLNVTYPNLSIRLTKSDLFLHAKMMIRDNSTLLMGSTNWSNVSLNENRELSIIIHNKTFADSVLVEFNKLWPLGLPVH